MTTDPKPPIPEAMVEIVAMAIDPLAFVEHFNLLARRTVARKRARRALLALADSGFVILPAEPTMKMVTTAALLAPEAGVGLCGAIYRAMRDAAMGGKE